MKYLERHALLGYRIDQLITQHREPLTNEMIEALINMPEGHALSRHKKVQSKSLLHLRLPRP